MPPKRKWYSADYKQEEVKHVAKIGKIRKWHFVYLQLVELFRSNTEDEELNGV